MVMVGGRGGRGGRDGRGRGRQDVLVDGDARGPDRQSKRPGPADTVYGK